MTAAQLAWRTTARYRSRAVLGVTGVAVIGALLFDMLLLSNGLLLSFADLLNSEGFDIRVVANQGLARVPIPRSAEAAAAIRALPSIADAALIRGQEAEAALGDRKATRVTLIGRTPIRADSWRLLRGKTLPDSAGDDTCPIVVDRALADALGTGPGGSIAITATPGDAPTALPAIRCDITGIADFGFTSIGEHTAATTMRAFQRAVGEQTPTEADLILVATRPEADVASAVRAIAALRPELHVYSNEDVVAQFNRNGFAYFRQISTVLSSLTIAFAFLLIATLLTVSINQRLGEIAALRALGIRRRRIAAMLLWESALLVGLGALLALPLGGALAVGLDHILRQMPHLPEGLHFFVFEPRVLMIHAIVFVVTAIASAVYPIWITARLPIAATLRREVIG
jgi:putative ABC transport system permease protein